MSVVDASVMLLITSGDAQGIVYVVAKGARDLLK